MSFTEDLSAFFNTSEFASQASLGDVAVRGIFDKDYQAGSVGGAGFASTQPMFMLPTSSLAGDPVGLLLVLDSANYTVVAVEPDSTGLSVLMLEAA